MSKISLEYNGDLRNSLIHLESKTEIYTLAQLIHIVKLLQKH